MDEIEQIKKAIAALEAQRSLLGDSVVDTALAPLREKLASLQPPPSAEQRRLITVLFADQVGFTAMSEKMDPEDVKAIVQAYYKSWTPSIGKYGGTVEKFIGDAVMAVFGLVVGREDDPENAVMAALEMRQALAHLNEEHQADWGFHLAMRTGIHTGPAIVTTLEESDGREFVALGDTLNLASRLQTIAPPDGILISQDTYRHVRGIFDVQALDPVTVKGKEEPVQAYLVLRAKRRSFRSPTRGVEGIETKMIGREVELQELKDALAASMDNRKAQVVSIIGEAGIGKSRLMAEFDNWVELLPQVVRYFKCRASPSMENLPYSLLRDLFSFRFQIQDSDSPGLVQEKLERGLGEFELPETGKRAATIGRLLGFKNQPRPALHSQPVDPKTLREMAVAYIVDYFKVLASFRTIVLLLEDIHWADESSLEVLEQVVESLPDQPLLVVWAARPTFFERHLKWTDPLLERKTSCQQIELKPLSPQQSQSLVEDILQKVDEIPDQLRELVVNRAEGNPFYLEELLKMLIEDGTILKEKDRWRVDVTRLSTLRPPSTLVEVLQARLDSLNAEEKVLLQRASVVGRIFWDDTIRSMEPAPDEQRELSSKVVDVLQSLDQREMVFPNTGSAFERTHEYSFKHALLRDVTYESVLKRLRRVYHTYAAQWLEKVTQRSGRTDEYAALIAEHYHQAGEHQLALDWFERAGIGAADRYANGEAIRCLTHCLDHVKEVDLERKYNLLLRRVKIYDTVADREAQMRDLEALQAIALRLDEKPSVIKNSRRAVVSHQWWHYYDAIGDTEASTAAALDGVSLAQAVGDVENEALGNLYLGATMWRKADFQSAQEYLEKSLALARQAKLFGLEGDALRNLGISYQYTGDYEAARANYEAAERIYHETGNEKGESMVLNSLGSLFTEQGHYHEAQTILERSLELKRKIGHRRAEHVTLHNIGIIANKLGRFTEAYKVLDQVLQFSLEAGDIEGHVDALLALGVISLHLGDSRSAQARIEEALSIYRRTGRSHGECDALASLGKLHYFKGDYPACIQSSQEALALAETFNLQIEKASLLDTIGHALLATGSVEEAVGRTQAALDLCTEIGEASRIAEVKTSLARAYLELGKRDEASLLIQEVLDYLTAQSNAQRVPLQEITYTPLEGMDEPFQALLELYQGLHHLQDPRAEILLDTAHRLLLEQAEQINNGEQRNSFLEAIPWQQEIMAEWDNFKSTQKT